MQKNTFEQELPGLLSKLDVNTRPLWGIMTPQHMVEHLIVTWKISRGRAKVPFMPNEDLAKKQAWLMTDEPYPRNIQISTLQGQLPPLRFGSLEEAREALTQELKAFHEYYDENPDARNTNPIFGDLHREQWHQLHFKHTRHHLTQFGLI